MTSTDEYMITINSDIARRFILGKQGLWLEDETFGKDEAFAEALARGFARFVKFLGASTLDATAVREPLLRKCAYVLEVTNSK